MSDHYHYEYADARHDHRGQYAEDRHDHDLDYTGKQHRHYDLESEDEKAQRRITALQDEIDGLRREMEDRIAALEAVDLRFVAALREATGRHEDTLRAGTADEANLAIAAELTEAFTAFSAALGEDQADEPEPEPEPYDPGPEIDDEGGMSEYRYPWPEDYERGQS